MVFKYIWNGVVVKTFTSIKYPALSSSIDKAFNDAEIKPSSICMDKERVDGCMDGMADGVADFMQIPQTKEEREVFYNKNREKILAYL